MADKVPLKTTSNKAIYTELKDQDEVATTIELEVKESNDTNIAGTETTTAESKPYTDPPLQTVTPLATDISFCTKLKLLLWKNAQIQCVRHPKGLCLTYGISIVIMLILVALATIETQKSHDNAYGFEFDYTVSNTGDAADFTTNYPMHNEMPWPDASIAHEWIKYLVCARHPLPALYSEQYDQHPPGYLAIVHPEIYSSNTSLSRLLNIMSNKYGDSSTYLNDFYDNAINENTWFSNTNGVQPPAIEEEVSEYRFCWQDANDTSYLNFTQGSLLKLFDSEQALEDYIASPKYGNPGFNFENTNPNATRPIGAAIVFNKIGDASNGLQWKYTLRVNMSLVPSTATSVDIFERNVNQLYAKSLFFYVEQSAFIQLQTWIDESIMEFTIRSSGNDNETVSDLLHLLYEYTTQYSKGVFMFPTRGYVQDLYWYYIGPVFGFYLFIMFCYPITEVLTILVDEKAKKIKETLNMMGATTTTYWLSWYCWFFVSFTLIALVITIIGVFGNVFRYSAFGVIFLWFWFFCLATGMMCCWMSTWFDNPKTASLAGVVLFLIFLSFGTLANPLSNAEKHGVCLIAPACFMISVTNVIQYESHQIGIHFDNIGDSYNDFAFESCLYMLAVDIAIYLLLNIYFDQVFPSKYGHKQVLWYFCLPSYWGCVTNEAPKPLRRISSVLDFGVNYEHFEEDTDEAQWITIRKLRKTFKKPGNWCDSKGEVQAVKDVSLDIYRGEIFCLLGHNGAGKSTTIGMMTGLLPITSGDAWILNHSINDPSETIEMRKHLGICPQHDVLWDRMSVEEHLWFFARLKGVPTDKTTNEVDTMLTKTHLNLDHNKDKFPTQMSGGQRRKLSLGIALIGGSPIVFLDEPTSGMDPANRRITWNLIQAERANRTIILTTHFMDEADILGDRIAIMSDGKVKCCGSSAYLKDLYGVGYTLTVSLDLKDENDKANAEAIKDDVDQEILPQITDSSVVSFAGCEITYRLPCDTFDQDKEKLMIKEYGISVTTLEEVFLRVGQGETDTSDNVEEDVMMDDMQLELDTFELNEVNPCTLFFIHVCAIVYKRFLWSIRDKQALLCTLFCPVIIALFGFAAGTVKLSQYTAAPALDLHPTNWYPSADEIVMPTTEYNGSFPTGTQGTDWWDIPNNNTFYHVYDERLSDDNGALMLQNMSLNVEDEFSVNRTDYFGTLLRPLGSVYPSIAGITDEFQDWLLARSKKNEPVYNSFLFVPYSMTPNQQKRVYLGINGSALHALPIATNVWNNWIINYILNDSAPNISITNHPLPPTYSQSLFVDYLFAFSQSIFFVIAFSFIPAAAIYFICNEKAQMSKHQQLVSGISYTSYWVGNYMMDVTAGYPAIICVVLLIYIFNSYVYEEAIGWFVLTLFLFLWSSTPFTYLLSFLFESPSKAQFTTIILYMTLGMVLGLMCLGLDFMTSESRDISTHILRPIFGLFPPFVLCESLINIGIGVALFPLSDYSDWEVLGRNMTVMAIEGAGYFALVLVIEYLGTCVVLLRKCGVITNMPITQDEDQLDDDVWEEKQRIKEGICETIVCEDDEWTDDQVIVAGLRKVFKRRTGGTCSKTNKFEAVKGLYFGVKKGECFGFLGVNGAGKTTTLSTLTGAQYPSSGSAFICGHDIVHQPLQCRRYIGYVPQFDALFDHLNCEEHLKFYGMVKGLDSDARKKQTEILLSALNLEKYREKLSFTYSGGNKRKLSVAVAMVGNPPVIFLDEPSTGIDPVSRRAMWTFISSTMGERSVILTTHSMEECEALCTRIGIMVNGQLQCIGNNQHLKSRFGSGYQLNLDLCLDDVEDDEKAIFTIQDTLTQAFGVIYLIEQHANRISYELVNNPKSKPLSAMFNVLQDMKENQFKGVIESYALSQTTLEQVFLTMARKQH
eukprot:164447_1